MWRAKVRIPAGLDRSIRDYAVRKTIKLRALIEEMIDEGAQVISAQGASYVFQAQAAWKNTELSEVEYVLGDDYRGRVDGLTAAMTGAGKRGKALSETLYISAKSRGIA